MSTEIDAEQTLLACCLYEGQASAMTDDDFYHESHRIISRAMGELEQEGTPIDLMTVCHKLEAMQQLKAVGGASYLTQLYELGIASPNLDVYRKIIKGKANLRRVVNLCRQTISQVDEGGAIDDVDKWVCDWEAKSLSACHTASDASIPIAQTVKQVLSVVEARMVNRSQGVVGLSTGFPDIDRILGGLKPASLYIIAGRPSMGKTAMGLCLCRNVALDGRKVLIFEYEMSREQLVYRWMGIDGKVDTTKIEGGYLSRDEHLKVVEAAGRLYSLPIVVNDDNAVTDVELQHIARKVKPDLIVVDHLSLVPTARRQENQNLRIGAVTKACKTIAKRQNIPVVALCQLNRKVEERGDKRPMLSDLRDSGEVEQDADCVCLLYRDEYYHRDSKERGVAEFNTAKNRNGRTGSAKLSWIDKYTAFESMAY